MAYPTQFIVIMAASKKIAKYFFVRTNCSPSQRRIATRTWVCVAHIPDATEYTTNKEEIVF